MFKISVSKTLMFLDEKETLVCGNVNRNHVHFTFSEDFDDLNISVYFKNNTNKVLVALEDNQCCVPWECLQDAEDEVFCGVVGTNQNNEVQCVIEKSLGVVTHGSRIDDAEFETEPTKTLVEQLFEKANNLEEIAESVREDADNGVFDGKSAYEKAVQNGFEGTEEEWMESLKGNPGEPGTSATHSWNGTVLTVTSASGTSSADLKGDKGEDSGRLSGAKAFTVVDMTFPPKKVCFSDIASSISVSGGSVDTSVTEYTDENSSSATYGVTKSAVKIDPSTSANSGELTISFSGLSRFNIDYSVYKYVAIELYMFGSRPQNANSKLTIINDSNINLKSNNYPQLYLGYVNPNTWWSNTRVYSLDSILNTDYEKHIYNYFTLVPCVGASGSSYNGNSIYLHSLTFYQNDPTVVLPENQVTTFTLDSVTGLEAGDTYSVHILTYPSSSIQTERAGTITAIEENVVTVSKQPINIYTFFKKGDGAAPNYIDENGFDGELNTFRVAAKPYIGNRKIGDTAVNFAKNGIAHSKGAMNFAEGGNAEGSYSFAAGKETLAEYCADASGVDTQALGHQSTTRGVGTRALRQNQLVIGSYNIPDLESLLIIGNGSSNENRHNALRVLANGTVEFDVGGTKVTLKEIYNRLFNQD